MADEFQLGSGNWWETSARNRYESPVGSATASTSSLNNNNSNNNSSSMAGSFGWPTEIVDIKARSSMDSVSVSGSSMVFQSDSQKLQPHESSPVSGGAAASGLLTDPNLQMMGLGLSSPTMDWNQALFRGEKGESSFRSMLQEEASGTNFPQQDQWRHKIYSGGSEDSSNISHDLKQMNRGLSLDQPQFSSTMSSGSNHPNFQLDSSATYGTSPPPNVLQGLLVSDNQQQQQQQQSMNYSYQISSGYGGMTAGTDQLMTPSWSNKFPPFLRTSPPKQPPQLPPHHHHHGQLHFSNNTPFWNASSAASMNDGRSSLFPSLQSQIPVPNFEEKSKNTSEARDLAIAKKISNESSNKRTRNEAPAPMPAFKVRKEKMGDRITALQQLVSPFGKTDTASVLSEAIEYIKFLHEQVSVLSTPYMKSGAPLTHQQNPDKPRDPAEGPKQDLRSRGLCLVPVSSTFPVTNETTVDFWTPTFGVSYR